MAAEGTVLVVLLACLPLLSVFKNVIHILARVIDLTLLAYLFAYDPCHTMEYVLFAPSVSSLAHAYVYACMQLNSTATTEDTPLFATPPFDNRPCLDAKCAYVHMANAQWHAKYSQVPTDSPVTIVCVTNSD